MLQGLGCAAPALCMLAAPLGLDIPPTSPWCQHCLSLPGCCLARHNSSPDPPRPPQELGTWFA